MGRKSEYSPEFRNTAVQLALAGEKPVAQVAKELGVDKHVLYSWVKLAKQNSRTAPAKGKNAESTPAEQQLKVLQRKYKQLEMENEILKKAAAYFAKTLL